MIERIRAGRPTLAECQSVLFRRSEDGKEFMAYVTEPSGAARGGWGPSWGQALANLILLELG